MSREVKPAHIFNFGAEGNPVPDQYRVRVLPSATLSGLLPEYQRVFWTSCVSAAAVFGDLPSGEYRVQVRSEVTEARHSVYVEADEVYYWSGRPPPIPPPKRVYVTDE